MTRPLPPGHTRVTRPPAPALSAAEQAVVERFEAAETPPESYAARSDATEGIAFGMFVLQAPIFAKHERLWWEMPDKDRTAWLAKARFVIGFVDVAAALGESK